MAFLQQQDNCSTIISFIFGQKQILKVLDVFIYPKTVFKV